MKSISSDEGNLSLVFSVLFSVSAIFLVVESNCGKQWVLEYRQGIGGSYPSPRDLSEVAFLSETSPSLRHVCHNLKWSSDLYTKFISEHFHFKRENLSSTRVSGQFFMKISLERRSKTKE